MNKWVIVGIGLLVVAAAAYVVMRNSQQEAGGMSVRSVQEQIVGRWQSTDDEKSVVVFDSDGTTASIYDDVELDSGTWEVYEGDITEYDPAIIFLRTNVNNDVFEYSVWNVNDTQLTINYLARGNTLNYQRIEE